jgi:hypothetical protein
MFQVLDSKTESLSSVTYTFSTSGDDWVKPFKHDYYPDLLIKQPVLADWQCELFGAGKSIVFIPEKGNVPNWFWRKMQYFILGNKWTKTKK